MNIIPQSVKLLLAKGKADTSNGIAQVIIPVPTDRALMGGTGWFNNQTNGDYAKAFLGMVTDGVFTAVTSFQDAELPDDNQGYYFPPNGATLDIHSLISNDPSALPAGLSLMITGYKADLSSDTLYVNLYWGKRLR